MLLPSSGVAECAAVIGDEPFVFLEPFMADEKSLPSLDVEAGEPVREAVDALVLLLMYSLL